MDLLQYNMHVMGLREMSVMRVFKLLKIKVIIDNSHVHACLIIPDMGVHGCFWQKKNNKKKKQNKSSS